MSLDDTARDTPRSPSEVLATTVELADRDVLDVGCGAGGLVRFMRSRGARVTGAECGAEMRRRAIAADPDHADSYVDAPGEALPFDDASFDVVVFSYSLHHVPIDDIPTALAEAHRVVRPGGTVYVVEPAVETPDDMVAVPVVDESVVRAAAQRAIDDAPGLGFEGPATRFEYLNEGVFESFEAWCDLLVGIDPDRAAALAEHHATIHEKFHRLGERRPGGWAFRSRNLVAVLTKRPGR